MEPVGNVTGSASERQFRFAMQEGALHRGAYVRVHHEDGPMLAQVTGVSRVKEGLLADAAVIGHRTPGGMLAAPATPFRPGDRVFRAEEGLIADVLGLGEAAAREASATAGAKGGKLAAYLGLLMGHDLPVHLDIDVLVQKHLSVMAKTGSGKSYVVGVLIEELAKHGVPVVVVDPHGEYASLANPNHAEREMRNMRRFGVRPRSYAEQLMEYSPDNAVNPDALPLRLAGRGLEARAMADMLGGKLSGTQLGLLHQAVRDVAAKRKEAHTLADLIAHVQRMEGASKWNLVASLQYLEGLGLLADEGTPVEKLVRRNQVTVVNLKGAAPEVQQIVVQWLCQAVFEARKVDAVPPCMLVVEEAHNFCPERGLQPAMSGDVLRTIASEGRKFGLGLAVVSQRPAKVDKNVLSQANTQVILKVTNALDLKAITSSVEGLSKDAEDTIQRLPVGVALVSHPRIATPVQVEIRPRETRHGGSSVSLLEAWRDEDGSAAPGAVPATATPGAAGAPAASSAGSAAPQVDGAPVGQEQDAPAASAAAGARGQGPTRRRGLSLGRPARRASPGAGREDAAQEEGHPALSAPSLRDQEEDASEPPGAPEGHGNLTADPAREAARVVSPFEAPTLTGHAAMPRPAGPSDAPAVQDLRALFQHVLREDLRGTPDANVEAALRVLEGRDATIRGLHAEFPGAPEVEELERLHRAAMARLRRVLEERRRGPGLLDRLRRGSR